MISLKKHKFIERKIYFNLQRDQLASHEAKVAQLSNELVEHKEIHRNVPPSKGLQLQNFIEKETYLQYEVITTPLFCFFHNINFYFICFFS